MLHGTTVATNLILEGKCAPSALITTAGFRHVLDIGRQDIPRQANLYAWIKPRRPVPASHVLEVVERVGPGGTVLTPLDEASVAEAAEACRRLGVSAVAICLLHSFAHPDHERRVAEILRAALPDVAVTASVDVLPVVREYERSLAAILNAGVMPAVSGYVDPARAAAAGRGDHRAAAADAVEWRRGRARRRSAVPRRSPRCPARPPASSARATWRPPAASPTSSPSISAAPAPISASSRTGGSA